MIFFTKSCIVTVKESLLNFFCFKSFLREIIRIKLVTLYKLHWCIPETLSNVIYHILGADFYYLVSFVIYSEGEEETLLPSISVAFLPWVNSNYYNIPEWFESKKCFFKLRNFHPVDDNPENWKTRKSGQNRRKHLRCLFVNQLMTKWNEKIQMHWKPIVLKISYHFEHLAVLY